MKAPCKKMFHFYSLCQEIIFTVVNGLTQNQSLTFSKLMLNKKRESKRLMHLLKIKCTNDNKWCYIHELNLLSTFVNMQENNLYIINLY